MAVLDRRTRSDPRRRATEQAFVRAAVALLEAGSSFADLNVQRIAGEAGRTRSAFYAHFSDRRDLLFAVVEEIGGEALSSIDPFVLGEGPIDREAIATSIGGLLAVVRRHAVLVRAVVEAAGYDARVASYWEGLMGRFVDATVGPLRRAGLSEESARGTATALVWMNERTCYQQVLGSGTGLDDATVVDSLTRVWWGVVRPAAGDRSE